MIKIKYVVLSLLTLVSIMLVGLFYSNLARAQMSTVTGYISVPPAAFVPCDNDQDVVNAFGVVLMNLDTGDAWFAGAVQLPNGATVTNVTFYWIDNGIYAVSCDLMIYNNTIVQYMAEMNSSGEAGAGSSYDDTINNATIDNSKYTYYFFVTIPASPSPHDDYQFKYAIIEYTLPSEPVGGLYIPVDKFSLLAPYIALVSTIILVISASLAYIKCRKKQ